MSDHNVQAAVGGIEAQRVLEQIQAGHTADVAWLRFAELAARYGWKSNACRCLVIELAKRAAAR